jgi:hypothetical protein
MFGSLGSNLFDNMLIMTTVTRCFLKFIGQVSTTTYQLMLFKYIK